MSRLHFHDDKFADLLAWAETVKPRVKEIEGLVFADIVRTGAGEGMVVAAYESEADFVAMTSTVADLFQSMTEHLTDRPHTHAGSSVFSFLD